MKTQIRLTIHPQPDDVTCGPSCLYSLYRHYGDDGVSLGQVIKEVAKLDGGGTLVEALGCHALRRGFHATIFSYRVDLLDPTWFAADGAVHDPADVCERLSQQLSAKRADARYRLATRCMREFLSLGGELKMEDLTPGLISRHVSRGVPILAGLSSTYLYRTAREIDETLTPDDVRGVPQGHFVMIVGYAARRREVLVADPLDPNPPYHTGRYRLSIDRLVNAVMLGVLTHDANLLVLRPGDDRPTRRSRGTRRRR
jgi:hypothetical protein